VVEEAIDKAVDPSARGVVRDAARSTRGTFGLCWRARERGSQLSFTMVRKVRREISHSLCSDMLGAYSINDGDGEAAIEFRRVCRRIAAVPGPVWSTVFKHTIVEVRPVAAKVGQLRL
jgi:hypothetical protein